MEYKLKVVASAYTHYGRDKKTNSCRFDRGNERAEEKWTIIEEKKRRKGNKSKEKEGETTQKQIQQKNNGTIVKRNYWQK